MMKLPKRRERPRSGIERAPQREWPRHRKFIRSLECVCARINVHQGMGGVECSGRIECCHLRLGSHAPMGAKPHDWLTFPACEAHHRNSHVIGEYSFQKIYRLDLRAIALGLARRSPDLEMRKALREIEGGA